jgi:hypothetical protein
MSFVGGDRGNSAGFGIYVVLVFCFGGGGGGVVGHI